MEMKKPFYEEWWFWICITVIIVCLTKGPVVTVAGNGNGSNNET